MRVVNTLGVASLLLLGTDALLIEQPVQVPLEQQALHKDAHHEIDVSKKRPLYGRFLHITDFHPDSLYRVYSSTEKDSACHRGQGPAGIYGAETSECDSPLALVNKTMDWVREQFRDSVDFVIWTGDSARHDSDDEKPRSRNEILDLNRFMVSKMLHAFGKENGDEDDEDPNNDFLIPIIPTFGNNDIMPHNIMVKGPNTWTRAYTDIWRQFIPEVQKHQFEQGGWFYVEVIPNNLAVFSLNTMYFFTNNAAVDGCAAHSEPGYRQMDWLRIQLQYLRDRGMKAILVGHVPPVRQDAKALFDETCWQKYTLWLRQYRDVVVSSMYGHFNYDHFILQDFHDIDADTENGAIGNYEAVGASDDLEAKISPSYFIQLRENWADLPNPPKSLRVDADEHTGSLLHRMSSWLLDYIPTTQAKKSKKNKEKKKQKQYLKKIGGAYAERFAASFVSASIVPNLYPTLRVFEYNITGLNGADHSAMLSMLPVEQYCVGGPDCEDLSTMRKKKHRKFKFAIPDPPAKTAPPGPAYSPQTLSLLRYTQYWANLTHINNDFTHDSDEVDAEKWREGKHKGKKPHDKDHTPNPKTFKFDVYYDTRDDDVYHLKDLTMPNLLGLARRIGNFVSEKSIDAETEDLSIASDLEDEKKKHKKKKGKKHHKGKHEKDNLPWYTFISRAFVQTMSPEEVRDQFGH